MSKHFILIFLHIASVAVWVGGMFFAYVCLRPVAAVQMDPAARLRLWQAVFARFFPAVTAAVFLILGSGLGMMAIVGFANAPRNWHWMMTSGIVMMLIFGHVYGAGYGRLKRAVAAEDWQAGGAALASIRRLVGINLVLGFVTIAIATLGGIFA